MFISILFIMVQLPVFGAPTCTGTKNVSLFQAGQSLANATITDQDGMFTCGSNTLAHVIKSSLKTTKEISYLDIAFQSAKKDWGKEYNPTKHFMVEKTRMAFEGMDNLCSSLNSMKANGGVCPREHFSFESTVYSKWGGTDPGQKQMELLLTLSKYLDVQNSNYSFKKPEEKLKELKKILKYIEDKKLTYAEKCNINGDGKNDVDFHETFQSLMGSLMLWISNHKGQPEHKACLDASIKYFNSFVTTPLNASDKHPLDIRSDMKKKYLGTYNYKALLSQWKKGLSPGGHEFSTPLAKFMDAQSAAQGLTKLCKLTEETADHPMSGKKLYVPELTKSVYKELNSALDSDECERKKLAEWVKSSKASKEVEALCPGVPGTRELMGALSVMPLWDENLAEILPRVIPKGQANLDNLTSILAPTCPQNRVNISKLNCVEHSAYVRMNQKPLEVLRSNFRDAAFRQLDKGNAVAVGICEQFLRGDSSLTIEACESTNSGYHATTVTGYRCVNGEMEYEVANSWGNNCPVKKGTKDKAIDCVLDAKGWPTGRFWVKEDTLLRNTNTFYEISQ